MVEHSWGDDLFRVSERHVRASDRRNFRGGVSRVSDRHVKCGRQRDLQGAPDEHVKGRDEHEHAAADEHVDGRDEYANGRDEHEHAAADERANGRDEHEHAAHNDDARARTRLEGQRGDGRHRLDYRPRVCDTGSGVWGFCVLFGVVDIDKGEYINVVTLIRRLVVYTCDRAPRCRTFR
jgi:hypothetical protein